MGCTVSQPAASAHPVAASDAPIPRTKAARGRTYDPLVDPKVRQLYAALGEKLIWAICYDFYKRVEGDKEMPEFTEVFSTPAPRASELLSWYLIESWGGPPLYSTARGSRFSFLYATHSVWRFQLTDAYWGRWIYHYLKAARHYCELQSAVGVQCPLVLPPVSRRAVELRTQMKLPMIEGGTDVAASTAVEDPTGQSGEAAAESAPAAGKCPFGALAPPGSEPPPNHPPVNADAAAPATAVGSSGAASSGCVNPLGQVLPEHIATIEYFLNRLREWMDAPTQAELEKNKYVDVFDRE